MEVVASLSQGRTAAAQCGLFTHKSVPVIFEPPCICEMYFPLRKQTILRNISNLQLEIFPNSIRKLNSNTNHLKMFGEVMTVCFANCKTHKTEILGKIRYLKFNIYLDAF